MTTSQVQEKEKRKYSRVPFFTRIDVSMQTGNGEKVELTSDSKDLSLRGAFVKTKQKFPIGTPCDIVIYLTGSIENIKLQIQGKVTRKEESGVGIVFDSMDLDTYTHLKNIVKYNSIKS